MDDVLREWIEANPERQLTGLLLRGREYPVKAPLITFDDEHAVWVLEKEESKLVVRASDVVGLEIAKEA